MAESEPRKGLEVHFAVWDNDLARLEYLLELEPAFDLELRDPSGYTPLLLAFALARTKAAEMLVAAGADPKARLARGWEAFQAAALTVNFDLLRNSIVTMLQATDKQWEQRAPRMLEALESMPDFEVEMTWDFKSWVPLVSRLLPNDTIRVWKRGSSLRMDSTLQNMQGLKWNRGEMSFIIHGRDAKHPGEMWAMDRGRKTVSSLRKAFREPRDNDIIDWMTALLTKPLKQSDFWSRDVVLEESRPRGWLGSKSKSVEQESVGSWGDCDVYLMQDFKINNLEHTPILKAMPELETWWKPEYSVKSTEGDSEAAGGGGGGGGDEAATPVPSMDVAADGEAYADASGMSALKTALSGIRRGGFSGIDLQEGVDERSHINRTCLPATFKEHFRGPRPEPTAVESAFTGTPVPPQDSNEIATFEGDHLKTGEKNLGNIRVCLSDRFPLTTKDFLPIASVLARTGRHFENFRSFFDTKFPTAGFPVKFSIPVFPTITANIEFTRCEVGAAKQADWFEVPADFKMDAYVDRSWWKQM